MGDEYVHIGVVTHYFDRIRVAVVLLDNELYLDDWILIYGPRTELQQQVISMQINREAIDQGLPGEEVAIKVDDLVREGDDVYLLSEQSVGD
jgi:hypothetical protein